MKRVFNYIGKYKKNSILAICFVVGETIMECAIPFVMAMFVKKIELGSGLNVIAFFGLVLFCLSMTSLLFGNFGGRQAAIASCGLSKNLRYEMFKSIQKYSFENLDKFQNASLVTRMTTDVTNVQMAYMMIVRIAIRSPLIFIFSITMSYIMGGIVSSVFLITVPLLVFGLIMIIKKAMPLFRKVFKKYDNLNNTIQENVKAMRVVKSFVREEYEKQKFYESANEIKKDFTEVERIISLNNPLMRFCLNFDMVVILFVGSYMIIKTGARDLDVGQLSAMLTYGFQILVSFMMLSMVYVMITMASEASVRIMEVLDEKTTLNLNADGFKEVSDGSVEFQNVCFKYSKDSENEALSNINLKIEKGQTVGILGSTGSGKTSLVQLIARLYDCSKGKILVGHKDVREYNLKSLRDQVAVVLQKNVLFSGTIKENLRYGNEEASDEEMIKACKIAQAHDFISNFKDGYNTYLEQAGANLSGGQKQRMCIARAILKNPKILILDDSTSALDMKTDGLLRKVLNEELKDVTKIIVAQRIASIISADQIVLMKEGKIVATGKHEDLIMNCDVYKDIYYSQMKEKENA